MYTFRKNKRAITIITILSLLFASVRPTSSVLAQESNPQTLDEVSVLAANVYDEATGENRFTPYIIKEIKVGEQILNVGILGITNTDNSRFYVPDNYPELVFAHPDNRECSAAWEVNRYVPKMRDVDC